MAVRSLANSISTDEYLRSAYAPDRDYVDGHLEERCSGGFEHDQMQSLVFMWLFTFQKECNVIVMPEQRVQVSATRFRVTDLCVFEAVHPREPIIRRAPLICIEVLSPDDTYSRLRERVLDYLGMGVQNVWVFDASSREALVWTLDGSRRCEGQLTAPGTGIYVPLKDIFSVLDCRRSNEQGREE